VPRLEVQRHGVDEGAIAVKQDSAGRFHEWKCQKCGFRDLAHGINGTAGCLREC
jgi:hypothetical protein